MKGSLGDIVGIPVIESKNIPEGTYMCFDENGLPIKNEDLEKKKIAKIMVYDIETFKLSLKYNQEREATSLQKED